MNSCRHVQKIRPSINHSVLNSQKWQCSDCFSQESVWACLSCPHVACGKYINNHIRDHYLFSKHPLSMNVEDKYVYCNECNDFILNDNVAGDIKILRNCLQAISNSDKNGFKLDPSKRGLVENLSPDKGNEFSIENKIDSNGRRRSNRVKKILNHSSDFLISHYPFGQTELNLEPPQQIDYTELWFRRYYLLAHCFRKWKSLSSVPPKESDEKKSLKQGDKKNSEEKNKQSNDIPMPKSFKQQPSNKKNKSSVSSSFSSSSSKSKKKRQLIPGAVGLQNLGNTCYMNSIIQVLRHLSPFSKVFIDNNKDDCLQINSKSLLSDPPSSSNKKSSTSNNRSSSSENTNSLSHSSSSIEPPDLYSSLKLTLAKPSSTPPSLNLIDNKKDIITKNTINTEKIDIITNFGEKLTSVVSTSFINSPLLSFTGQFLQSDINKDNIEYINKHYIKKVFDNLGNSNNENETLRKHFQEEDIENKFILENDTFSNVTIPNLNPKIIDNNTAKTITNNNTVFTDTKKENFIHQPNEKMNKLFNSNINNNVAFKLNTSNFNGFSDLISPMDNNYSIENNCKMITNTSLLKNTTNIKKMNSLTSFNLTTSKTITTNTIGNIEFKDKRNNLNKNQNNGTSPENVNPLSICKKSNNLNENYVSNMNNENNESEKEEKKNDKLNTSSHNTSLPYSCTYLSFSTVLNSQVISFSSNSSFSSSCVTSSMTSQFLTSSLSDNNTANSVKNLPNAFSISSQLSHISSPSSFSSSTSSLATDYNLKSLSSSYTFLHSSTSISFSAPLNKIISSSTFSSSFASKYADTVYTFCDESIKISNFKNFKINSSNRNYKNTPPPSDQESPISLPSTFPSLPSSSFSINTNSCRVITSVKSSCAPVSTNYPEPNISSNDNSSINSNCDENSNEPFNLEDSSVAKRTKSRRKRMPSKMSLSEELNSLLRIMWSGKMSMVSPHKMLNAVWNIIPFFKGYSQQDAQEFLSKFLDKVQSEMDNKILNRKISNSTTSTALKNMDSQTFNSKSSNERLKTYEDIVTQLFQGELISQVSCLSCGNQSKIREAFMDLSLEFPLRFHCNIGMKKAKLPTRNQKNGCKLEEMMSQFMQVEKLDGKIYVCDHCNRENSTNEKIYSEVEKRFLISRLPSVLRLHLKRFMWSGKSSRGKIGVNVAFPHHLDVTNFCHDDIQTDTFIYKLSAVVMHHGRGFGSGHYTAYCWNMAADSWMHCNDAKMQKVGLEEVHRAQAYILVYTKLFDQHLSPHDISNQVSDEKRILKKKNNFLEESFKLISINKSKKKKQLKKKNCKVFKNRKNEKESTAIFSPVEVLNHSSVEDRISLDIKDFENNRRCGIPRFTEVLKRRGVDTFGTQTFKRTKTTIW